MLVTLPPAARLAEDRDVARITAEVRYVFLYPLEHGDNILHSDIGRSSSLLSLHSDPRGGGSPKRFKR